MQSLPNVKHLNVNNKSPLYCVRLISPLRPSVLKEALKHDTLLMVWDKTYKVKGAFN